MFSLFKRNEKNSVELIDDGNELVKIDTLNGPVYAKKVLSVEGKHIIYVDQYGNVKEAFLK